MSLDITINVRWRPVLAALVLALGLMVAHAARPAAAGNGSQWAFPPKSHPYGKSYAQWGAEWWQWAGNFPLDGNPITEGSGPVEYGDANDQPPGQVWFLAGTFGDGPVERELTVPKGKALFFPQANGVFWAPEDCEWLGLDEDHCNAAGLTGALEDFVAANYDLAVSVDGQNIPNPDKYLGISAPFTLDILDGTMWADFGYDLGPRYPTVSGGHWMFLKPLPPGEHTVHFEAKNSIIGEDWMQDVTYLITVEN